MNQVNSNSKLSVTDDSSEVNTSDKQRQRRDLPHFLGDFDAAEHYTFSENRHDKLQTRVSYPDVRFKLSSSIVRNISNLSLSKIMTPCSNGWSIMSLLHVITWDASGTCLWLSGFWHWPKVWFEESREFIILRQSRRRLGTKWLCTAVARTGELLPKQMHYGRWKVQK